MCIHRRRGADRGVTVAPDFALIVWSRIVRGLSHAEMKLVAIACSLCVWVQDVSGSMKCMGCIAKHWRFFAVPFKAHASIVAIGLQG